MTVDLTPAFSDYLARNRGPVPGDPDTRQQPAYGVVASLEGGFIKLALTFRAGAAYCCSEWGCHLSASDGTFWEWLRRELQAHGLVAPPLLVLHLTVVVETGALFFDFSRPDQSRRGWYEFTPAKERRYQHVVSEEGRKMSSTKRSSRPKRACVIPGRRGSVGAAEGLRGSAGASPSQNLGLRTWEGEAPSEPDDASACREACHPGMVQRHLVR